MANKEQKKVQKAAPKSNKQKKEAQREKKAASVPHRVMLGVSLARAVKPQVSLYEHSLELRDF